MKKADSTDNWPTRETLLDFAGEVYFARGEDYFQRGKVVNLSAHMGSVQASVDGTRRYQVMLQPEEDGGVTWSCSCPLGERGEFCKHAVAVGLAWLSLPKNGNNMVVAKQDNDDFSIVRRFLEQQPKEALIQMLMGQASEDDLLLRRLILKAQRTQADGIDLKAFKKQMRSAINVHSFWGYRDMPDYVRGINEVIEELEACFAEGRAKETIELAEYGLKLVEKAMEDVDDSDGMLGDVLRQLEELHLAACLQARPDPVKLGEKLFQWEMTTGWDTFFNAAEKYEDVLGEKGLARYCGLAKAAWDALPPLRHGEAEKAYDGKRFRLSHIMENLAGKTGGLEALVEVKSKDLSSAHRYMSIAKLYLESGQLDQALHWAQKGYDIFKGQRQVQTLAAFLVEEYIQITHFEKAIPIAWAVFSQWPDLSNYQLLHESTNDAGCWNDWREKALELARDDCSKQQGPWSSGRSLLVEIFLWEGDLSAAMQQAREGGCSSNLWLELASALEQTSPGEAADIYRLLVAPAINRGNNKAYAEALQYIKKMEALLVKDGKNEDFADFTAEIRREFKRKRNMMKLMDRQGW